MYDRSDSIVRKVKEVKVGRYDRSDSIVRKVKEAKVLISLSGRKIEYGTSSVDRVLGVIEANLL